MLTAKEVPLDSITLRDDFRRQEADMDKQAELVLSIKTQGILYPLICIDTLPGLTLIAGYRRYHAAKVLGLPTVPCICLNVGIDDAEILRLHENLYREDISPVDEADAMSRLEVTYHFTRSKIANLLGKSASYVTQRLQIRHWNQDLKHALSLGQLSYSVARELSGVSDPDTLFSMLKTVISSGASVRTVATWIQEWKAGIIAEQQPPPPTQPTAETKPTADEPTSCFTCGTYLSSTELTTISVCSECLDMIKAIKS